MRIQISHETVYRYEEPARGVIQTLRLTPRNHDGQYVENWRIDVSENCQLDQHEDAFGNITHVFSAEGPFSELRVLVEGEVDTQDTAGVVVGAIERFPPSLYLRETPLTQIDPAIAAFAEISRQAGDDPLKVLHDLLGRLHDEMTYDEDSDRSGHHGGRGVRAEARPMPGPDAYLHRRVAEPRHPGALHRRPLPARRWRHRSGGGARLGRGFRPGARLGRLRYGQLHLRDGRACAGRGRPRLSGSGPGARHPLWRRQRESRRVGSRQLPGAGPAAKPNSALTAGLLRGGVTIEPEICHAWSLGAGDMGRCRAFVAPHLGESCDPGESLARGPGFVTLEHSSAAVFLAKLSPSSSCKSASRMTGATSLGRRSDATRRLL